MNKYKLFLGGLVAVAGVALISGLIISNKSSKSAKTPANVESNNITNNQTLVGQVVSLSSGKIYVKDEKSGELRNLYVNDKLHLGDIVIAGRGVNATLKLSRPRGISEDAEMVFIRPMPGEEYIVNVKLQRNDDGSIETTISS